MKKIVNRKSKVVKYTIPDDSLGHINLSLDDNGLDINFTDSKKKTINTINITISDDLATYKDTYKNMNTQATYVNKFCVNKFCNNGDIETIIDIPTTNEKLKDLNAQNRPSRPRKNSRNPSKLEGVQQHCFSSLGSHSLRLEV